MIDEIDDMMAHLADSMTAGRTRMDRYREFRQVFMGSDAGKRVLYDILAWGHLYQTSMRSNPHQTAFHEGERHIGLKIMTTVHLEPSDQPDHQQSTEPK